jgi:hypothetical protein
MSASVRRIGQAKPVGDGYWGVTPVRSELIYLLVRLDKEYAAEQPGEPWESYYARRLPGHFSRAGP